MIRVREADGMGEDIEGIDGIDLSLVFDFLIDAWEFRFLGGVKLILIG